jgi:hypothetical protein
VLIVIATKQAIYDQGSRTAKMLWILGKRTAGLLGLSQLRVEKIKGENKGLLLLVSLAKIIKRQSSQH